jgi:phospholipase D1/2
LDNEHKNDFRNKSWPYSPDSGGPRQPWHDWHCKIEGHAAYDVLTNFEQRWKKATKTHDEELLDIDRHGSLVAPSNKAPLSGDPALHVSNDYDPETWQVQIFRSIDSGSVKGFPQTGEEVTKQFLVWGKSVAIDISIQMAYIKAIRCAQHFIYIENQYFLGSSYNWPDYKTAGANHLIPMELTLKICSKIKANQRFAVYIVIPMWPEGVPEGGPVQEILYFQTQTMKMMYRLIGDTLKDCGLSHRKPTDYLNFYCLGNRETKKPGEYEPPKPPAPNSNQGKSQKNRRMMIYVHSKGMIVDDEYVISGSANINQRSMDGSRDTEIAMGGYQPHHTWLAKHNRPRGQVYGYRMSLWAEHLGLPLDPLFEEPESIECVRRVNDMSDRNWDQYNSPEVTDMRGHLIRYPLKIEDDGTIRNLPGVETFPDVGGKIMGSNQEQLPDDLTA